MTEDNEIVLLTGGLGQLGSYVYSRLKDKYSIVILDNESNAKIAPPLDCTYIKKDIKNKKTYSSLPDITHIIHCAAQISISKSTQNPLFDANINIMGTLNLLEYARNNDVKKFITISSAATYGEPQFLPITESHPRDPLSPYGLSKLVAERYSKMYANLYGMDICSILPFNIYSPLQKEDDPYAGVIYKFIKRLKSNLPPKIEGDGKQTRDFIHAKDVSVAIESALQINNTKGETFNIGSGKPLSILSLANLLIDISGKNLKPKHMPPRIGDIRESYSSIKKAEKTLHFVPQIPLKPGLTEMFTKINP